MYMKKIDLFLQTIIYQAIEDMSDASVHYLIYAKYFFYDIQMNDFEPFYFNRNSIKRIELLTDGFKCKMMLDGREKDDIFSIKIPFQFISKISRFSVAGLKEEEMLFCNNGI